MPKPRSIQEINNAYFQKAAMLGDLEWKMSKFPAQIEALKRDLRAIDNEADEAQKAQAKEQAKEQAKASNTPAAPEQKEELQAAPI
jgi:hypothetical protein